MKCEDGQRSRLVQAVLREHVANTERICSKRRATSWPPFTPVGDDGEMCGMDFLPGEASVRRGNAQDERQERAYSGMEGSRGMGCREGVASSKCYHGR